MKAKIKEQLTEMVGKRYTDVNGKVIDIENYHVKDNKTVVITKEGFIDLRFQDVQVWIDGLSMKDTSETVAPSAHKESVSHSFTPELEKRKDTSLQYKPAPAVEKSLVPAELQSVNNAVFGEMTAALKSNLTAIKSGEKPDYDKIKAINGTVNTMINLAKVEIEVRKLGV